MQEKEPISEVEGYLKSLKKAVSVRGESLHTSRLRRALQFLQSVFPAPSLLLRAVFLAVGIVVLCFGSSLYMTADLGVSTYDAIAIVLSRKWKLGKFQYCRIGADLACVLSGCGIFLLAGGSFRSIPTIAGIGTIITAFFMGPLIQYFNGKIAQPLLERPAK